MPARCLSQCSPVVGRYNLIMWLRSSEVRNQRCPMCRRRPTVLPVAFGTGDGFVQYTEDVCAAS